MNDKDVVNLVKYIKGILFTNRIGCANDFFNEVKARLHHRHISDTGDLLPSYYLNVLSTCFVIFGIFPRDWQPQTENDFDAMIKYNQRLIDKLASEVKL